MLPENDFGLLVPFSLLSVPWCCVKLGPRTASGDSSLNNAASDPIGMQCIQ